MEAPEKTTKNVVYRDIDKVMAHDSVMLDPWNVNSTASWRVTSSLQEKVTTEEDGTKSNRYRMALDAAFLLSDCTKMVQLDFGGWGGRTTKEATRDMLEKVDRLAESVETFRAALKHHLDQKESKLVILKNEGHDAMLPSSEVEEYDL